MKRWWAENRRTRRPVSRRSSRSRLKKDYQLPLGVERDGDLVHVPGTAVGDVWTVDTTIWACTCPAFDRWPPCKHVVAVKGMVKSEGR